MGAPRSTMDEVLTIRAAYPAWERVEIETSATPEPVETPAILARPPLPWSST